MWQPVLAPLVEQFRVVRLDHRGHGASAPSPHGADSDLADLGADVLTTLDDLGIERADWVGLSLGAMVGMWLAIHRPERVARLALLCTSAHLGSPYLERADVVRAEGMAAVADAVVDRWLTPALHRSRSRFAFPTSYDGGRHRFGKLRTVLRGNRNDGPAP